MADTRPECIAYMGEHTGSLEAGLAKADILFSLLLTPPCRAAEPSTRRWHSTLRPNGVRRLLRRPGGGQAHLGRDMQE